MPVGSVDKVAAQVSDSFDQVVVAVTRCTNGGVRDVISKKVVYCLDSQVSEIEVPRVGEWYALTSR